MNQFNRVFRCFCRILLITICLDQATGIKLTAYLSQNGVHGEITFTYLPSNRIRLQTHLKPTIEFPNSIWSWSINEFPVDYTLLQNRCNDENMGKELFLFDDKYGYLSLPENETSEIILAPDELTITGEKGLYGKSLLLRASDSNTRICSVITVEDKSVENIAVANFRSPIAGSIHFRWIATKYNHTDTLIQTDLYHVGMNDSQHRDVIFLNHKWKIFVTDILEDSEKSRENCNRLQLIFDPKRDGEGKAVGDIDNRIGKLKVATRYDRVKHKVLLRDDDLFLLPSDIKGPKRQLYVVIFDENHLESFLGCAKIQHQEPVTAKTIIQSEGIEGDIVFRQYSRFDPTFISFNLKPAKDDLESQILFGSQVGGYKIHELPKMPTTTIVPAIPPCLTTKMVYNPTNVENNSKLPPPGFGTQDQYAVGDLSGKLLGRNNSTSLIIPGTLELKGSYWDVFLPMMGVYSVIHRSVVIYKNNETVSGAPPSRWICGNIALYDRYLKQQTPITSARVIFRYPIVGSILFRQKADDQFADTTILIEKLVHADGAQLNNTHDHRWAIHTLPTGKDYYNWTARCLSAGDIYNPNNVVFDPKNPSDKCSLSSIGLCRLGDLSSRMGGMSISGKNIDGPKISSKLYTDTNLPLAGTRSILGQSVVIYDDFGPVARGERLACSDIHGVFRRKAVVKDWYGNGDPSTPLTVKGKIELVQQTEYDITNVEVDLQGLSDNSGYHVHMVSVRSDLEFPCEGSTLYDHWNPLKVDPLKAPKRYHGTTDQYEMGDLSGKFGTLDKRRTYSTTYNDTMLPLFGQQAIIGRSVIIHKRDKNRRWACSSIERGYSPSEARELRAIASFHNPAGYAFGYIRMTQLVHSDGSKSETVIEVNLRHPGVNDRNVTKNHNWAVYVNPVGVDATVKVYDTRCVAGGYIWNPYFTQLADPLNHDLYRQECQPDNPLRCHVGDLSSRLGTIDIGLKRQVFTDYNLPLEGDVTAVGRSIVIFSPDQGGDRFACANIEPDYDIVKYSNIEKPPRFVLAQFIDDIRSVMGVPEWMISVDVRKTKYLHNGYCIQFLLHFQGPIANKLEIDYTRLIINGRLDAPSLYVPGYINTKRKATIPYKQCGVTDPNEKQRSRKGSRFYSSGSAVVIWNSVLWIISLGICSQFF